MEQQLAACLEATLSPDAALRTNAESQLKSLRAPEHDPQGHAGLGFVKVLLDPSTPVHIRQSAGLALRKYVTARWSPYFDGFVGSAVDVSVKQQIRSALLPGLSDPVRKIRLATSYAISTIAGPDYPDEYPDLLPHIQQLLAHPEPNGLHGAMTLLSEFVRVEMDEVQLIQVAKEILPALEQVLALEDAHSAYIRARCVLVFRQCLTTLYMVKETYRMSSSKLPHHSSTLALHHALDALLRCRRAAWRRPPAELGHACSPQRDLQDPQGGRTLPLAVQVSSARLHPVFARQPRLAPSALSSAPPVNASDVDLPSSEEGDDDVASDVPSLVSSILDFINDASRGDRCRDIFVSGGTGGNGNETPALQQLIGLLLVYIDMTTDDEDNWATDANAFIADEDDETLAYSLRIAVADLLGMLIEDFPVPSLRSIGQQAHQLVDRANADRANGDQDWWKIHEGVLTAIGNNADAITDIVDSQSQGKQILDLESIFTTIVLPNVDNDAPPFCRTRLRSSLALLFLALCLLAVNA